MVTLAGGLVGCSSPPQVTTGGSGHQVGFATFSGSAGDVRTDPLRVADSDEERADGLMGRTSLPRNGGMVFVFDGPTEASFWMRDTLIPLSIAFWGADDRIIDIMEMEPCEDDPCPTYHPDQPYTHALEMNRGWFTRRGIDVGETVELQFLTE
jgi:uncharacterized membrane protein (UPF0127 family)